jgi:pimeloyl-ACP methyl ester carboxylesterase
MIEYGNGVNVANLIPGARLHSFDDVGHLFWWERTVETAELTIEHCLAQGPSGGR